MWIAATSLLSGWFAETAALPIAAVEVAKGLLFVLVTGLALYVALRRFEGGWLEAERRYRVIVEQVQEGLYLFRLPPDHGFVYVNPALEASTGFPAEDFYANPDLALQRLHPEDRHVVDRSRRQGGIGGAKKVRWRHADGHWVWHELKETPVEIVDEKVRTVQGLAIDITRTIEEERALARALEHEQATAAEAREANAMKTGFLQALSHELRSPLTAIIGFASTLDRQHGRLSDEQARTLARSLRQRAEHLHGLLSDLLDLEQLGRDIPTARRRPTDIAALIRQVADHIDMDGHELRLTLPDELTAALDGPKVERIVENLLVNAVRHTPEGSTIWVTVARENTTVTVTVEDDGPGISPEIEHTLFDAFTQGPERRASPNPGVGIGLSLVDQFARLHGGYATADASPHGGARFRIVLPEQPEVSAT